MELIGGLLAPALGGSGATAAATGATAAGGGFSLASVLQSTATVLGIVSSISAGDADAARYEAQAADAEAEQALETLQGIDRSTQTRKALLEATGAIDTAYAASGIDLSVGTVAQARGEAYREADFAIASEGNTQINRQARLSERAGSYRSMAKRARRAGWMDGFTGALPQAASLLDRGGPSQRRSLRPRDPWAGLR